MVLKITDIKATIDLNSEMIESLQKGQGLIYHLTVNETDVAIHLEVQK